MTAEHRPIVLARKPGPLRPLAIDDCRIGTTVETWPASRGYSRHDTGNPLKVQAQATGDVPPGRWPSNVLLSDPALFDEKNAEVVGSGATSVAGFGSTRGNGSEPTSWDKPGHLEPIGYGDSGGYSRFFRIPDDDLLGHLTKLVSAPGEVVYDPFPFELRTAP
jgi:hypothetical protein